jgi:hypothetical protein
VSAKVLCSSSRTHRVKTSPQNSSDTLTMHDLQIMFGALSTTQVSPRSLFNCLSTHMTCTQQPDTDVPTPAAVNHIEEFFANYSPEFEYLRTNTATYEYRRLCRILLRDDREKAWMDFRDALVLEFNKIYGTDENDLGSWQALCRVLDIVPVPTTLRECRQVCCQSFHPIGRL